MLLLELSDWTAFKFTCITTKKLSCQYTEAPDRYEIYGPEISVITWRTTLLKTDIPNADQIDFETNYKFQTFNSVISSTTKGVLVDYSGTTALLSGTSTQIAPSNPNRKYLFIQNVGKASIWINFTQDATQNQPSIQLAPGASFVMEGSSVTTEAVNVVSGIISVPFVVKEK